MKKIIALALTFCMIFSLTVMAGEDTEVKEVLTLIKGRLPDTEGFEHFESTKRQSGENVNYSFMWYSSGEDYKEMMVRATKSGIILSYNYYEEEKTDNRPTVNKPYTEEFLDEAKELSDKINPLIKDKIEISCRNMTESLYGNDYYFTLTHVENGIPVYGNTGFLVIASDGVTLKSYSLNFDEGVSYENPQKIIGKDEAKEAFYKEIGMELKYRTKYDGKERSTYLSYMPKVTYGTYIDAFTGKAITPEAYEGGMFKTMNSASEESVTMDSAAGSVSFSEAELSEFEKLSELLSKEESEKIIKGLNLLRENDLKAESFTTNRDYYDEEIYYHNLTYRTGDYYARVKLDAKSGKIMSFYQSDNFMKDDKEIKESEAKKAIDKVVDVLSFEDAFVTEESENAFTRRYKRIVNDIPYEDDNIHITVSKKDGSLISYSYSYTDIEFPSPDGVISEKEAAYKLIEQKEYKPYYYISRNKDKEIKTYLIYMFTEGPYEIDGFTGELKNPYGVAVIPEYKDIEGHFAEEAIKTLARFGIGFEEENFRPDDAISQKDYLTLLTMAIVRHQGVVITKDYDAGRIYNDSYIRNILDKSEIDEDAVVTRLNGAIYFIRALGLDEVASLENIFACPFSDVSEKEGYVSILYGLNVIKGDSEGKFNPQKSVTRAEAALMIYNYLSR